MSSLPLGFFAPWQPKQYSLRIGATSLMKLTAPAGDLGGGGAAPGAGAATRVSRASAPARAAQRIHRQRGRDISELRNRWGRRWSNGEGRRGALEKSWRDLGVLGVYLG